MFRFIIVSLFAVGFFLSGCTSEKQALHHRGCHRVGANRAGHNNGIIHHHHAKPQQPVEEKKE